MASVIFCIGCPSCESSSTTKFDRAKPSVECWSITLFMILISYAGIVVFWFFNVQVHFLINEEMYLNIKKPKPWG